MHTTHKVSRWLRTEEAAEAAEVLRRIGWGLRECYRGAAMGVGELRN
jgi:hypothetical protein